MRDDFPSITAAFVAFSRGVASAHPMIAPPIGDLAARSLLPFPASSLIPTPGSRAVRPWQGALRAASLGLVDHLALRTAAVDAALLDALHAGISQVVLLGAGLDARAYRVEALRSARVFEVDHPATQRYKRGRLSGLTPMAARLTHVPVDFATDSLEEALASAGHDEGAPSFWIWEGVTMYLPEEATRATLHALAARSSPGSRLLVSYMTPEGPLLPAPLRSIAEGVFGLFGEPIVGAFAPEAMRRLLGEEGFRVEQDEHSIDWARRFGGNRFAPIIFRSERLALGRKGS